MEVLILASFSGSIPFILLMSALLPVTLTQEEQQLRYEVEEEKPGGTVIGDLAKDSGLADEHSAEILNELQFQFLVANHVNISVNGDTGVLSTSGRIDREEICARQETCQVLLDIAVQPVNYFRIIKVLIVIIDINDQVPSFGKFADFSLSIKESSSLESSFLIPAATDDDSPMYSIDEYRLLPSWPLSKFALMSVKKLDGSTDVRLILKGELDRESEDSYEFRVVAFDKGSIPQEGALDLHVIVEDSNDNDPVFDNATYEVTILESTPARSMVLTVHATDKDIGENGEVIYEFSEKTLEMYGRTFGIDQQSGEIYMKDEVDHETVSVYHLTVMARDLGPDSLPADATVVINVGDINDNAPRITVSTLNATDTNKAFVTENLAEGTFVALVRVKDPDGGRNGQFNCSLTDEHFILVRNYDAEFQVLTSAILDRETTSQYNLNLVCKDGGNVPNIAMKPLEVGVGDVNDNPPIFTRGTYTAVLIENSYVGASVIQVNATDGDAGANAHISYRLVGPKVDSFFHIDEQGRITALRSINREEDDQFQFQVVASDGGIHPQNGTAQVTVIIEDVNDVAPSFVDTYYPLKVEENQPPGTVVGVLTANDTDQEPYNLFRFSFASGGTQSGEFEIDPEKGIIKTIRPIDREKRSVYYLVAQVTDLNSDMLSGTVSITVYVIDVNDNAPLIQFPSRNNHTVYLSNKVPIDYIATKVLATDLDSKRNARLTYSLQGDSHYGTFSIDSNLGTVSVEMDLSEIDYRVFDFEIEVQDQGRSPLSSSAPLNIVVNKSIPFAPKDVGHTLLDGSNFVIVISLSCVCAVVAVILVVAIVFIRRGDRSRQQHKYNCRMEALTHKAPSDGLYSAESSPTKCVTNLNGRMNGGGSFLSINDLQKEEDLHRYCIQERSFGQARKHEACKSIDNYRNPGPWLPQTYKGMQATTKTTDADEVSVTSCDGSNTDSGRGASEEGDRLHVRGPMSSANRLPLHPPPPPSRTAPSFHNYPTLPYRHSPSNMKSSPAHETQKALTSFLSSKDSTSLSSLPTLDSADSGTVQARPPRVSPIETASARQCFGHGQAARLSYNTKKQGNSVDKAGSLEMATRQTYTTDTLGDIKSVVV